MLLAYPVVPPDEAFLPAVSLCISAPITVLVLPIWRSSFAGLVVRVVVEDVVAVHLCHQVEALSHTVGSEASLGVMVPALRDGVTQKAHSLQSEELKLRSEGRRNWARS